MFEIEQNRETLPSPQPLKMDSSPDTTAEYRVPQIEQHPKLLPLQQVLEMKSDRGPTTIAKAPMTRANWVNALWADISGQLRRFAVISHDLFDGLLLKRDTDTGLLILGELVSLPYFAPSFCRIHGKMLMVWVQRKNYEQLGNDRNLASVRVLTPERLTGGMWQLLWTIKRHRDPNGRESFFPGGCFLLGIYLTTD